LFFCFGLKANITELLKTSEDELSAAITGAKTSKAALESIAEGHAKYIKK
jgi:hypothetical protein